MLTQPRADGSAGQRLYKAELLKHPEIIEVVCFLAAISDLLLA